MKVGLLGTGFGIAVARIYHTHPEVSDVVVFGRTPAKRHCCVAPAGADGSRHVHSGSDRQDQFFECDRQSPVGGSSTARS